MENHTNEESSLDEIDLNEEWKEAWSASRIDFLKTHNKDLGGLQVESPDDVLDSIRSKRKKDDDDNAKHAKAKSIIGNVLSVVQLLGDLAGQGASIVFGGPASMCFNAVSFLISAGERYNKIFADLIELFDEVSSFLDRFKVYQRMDRLVDNSLKRVIHEALLCFVSICRVGVSVLNNKTTLFFKSLVSGDRVQDELIKLRIIVEQESRLRGALVYETTRVTQGKAEELDQNVVEVKGTVTETHTLAKKIDQNTAKQSEQLVEVATTSKKMASDQKKTGEIVKTMQLKEEQKEARKKVSKLLGQTDEGVDPYEDNIGRKIPRTGEWLLENEQFKSWASRDSNIYYLLCLKGDESMGKTFAAYTAIQELKSQCQPDITSTYRVSVAYYFFESNTQSISKALKSLASQISQTESVFQRRLLQIQRVDDVVDITNLWDKLFDQPPISDTTLFLVLDGLDHLEAELEDFRQLLAHINSKLTDPDHNTLNVRILLTTTSHSHQATVEPAIGRQFPVIEMIEENTMDRELFMENKLDQIFKKSSPQVDEIKQEVIQGLLAIEEKDFTNLDYILRSIGRTSVRSEISEIIARAMKGEGIRENIRDDVRRLNTNLSAHDKLELNEVLLWVMYAGRTLTVGELDSVLSLTRIERSFQDLYEQIDDREKYGALLSVKKTSNSNENQDAEVSLCSEHVRTYFEETSAIQQEGSDVQDGGVNKAEVQILKRFLWNVCDEELYYKFGFEEFLRRKMQNVVISKVEVKLVEKYLSTVCDGDLYTRVGFQDFFDRKLSDVSMVGDLPLQAYSIHLALVCLKALCDPKAVALHEYAGDCFHDHLMAVNLDTARPDSKAEIVQHLIRVFTEDEIISRWWPGFKLIDRTEEWMFPDSKSTSIIAWFKKVSVNGKVGKSDHDWLMIMNSKMNPDIELLRPIAKWMSRMWLAEFDSEWELYEDYFVLSISALVNKIENAQSQESSPSKSLPLFPNQAMICKALAWVKKETSIKEDCTYYICLGNTYSTCELPKQALSAYEQALKFDVNDNTWRAKLGLIDTYDDMANYGKVIQHAIELKEDINQGKYSSPQSEDLVWRASLKLAKAYDKTGQLDEALQVYRSSWEENPDDYNAVWGIATALTKKKEYDELESFFLDLKKDSDEKFMLDRLSTAYLSTAYCDNFYEYEHGRLAGFLRKAETIFELVKANCQHTQATIEGKLKMSTSIEDKKKWSKELNAACYIYGSLLVNLGATEDALSQGIKMLESILSVEELPGFSSDEFEGYLWQTARTLSKAYLSSVKSDPELNIGYLDRLRKLSDKTQEAWSLDQPQLLLGRMYSYLGQTQEARKSLRGMIKIGFDYLSDADEENDWQGYVRLAQCLLLVDDKVNAAAAWSLIAPTSESASNDDEGSISSSENLPGLSGPLPHVCDGNCGKRFLYANDFWACCDCSDVQFCQPCIDKLKADELQSMVCSKDHSHLHIPRWDFEKAAELPEKHVRVSDDVLPIDEWIKILKVEWDLV